MCYSVSAHIILLFLSILQKVLERPPVVLERNPYLFSRIPDLLENNGPNLTQVDKSAHIWEYLSKIRFQRLNRTRLEVVSMGLEKNGAYEGDAL